MAVLTRDSTISIVDDQLAALCTAGSTSTINGLLFGVVATNRPLYATLFDIPTPATGYNMDGPCFSHLCLLNSPQTLGQRTTKNAPEQ